jgi:N-acetylglucosaminyldiphosphoundecaprenol N-acetyl-beta-D-mannosaminyltransferase
MINYISTIKNKSLTSVNTINEIFQNDKTVIYINAVSYQVLKKNKFNISSIDRILIDGIFLLIFVKLFIKKNVVRATFDMTSIAPSVFEISSTENKRVFLLGAKRNEIDNFSKLIKNNYPNLNVVGFRDGYFRLDDNSIYEEIFSTEPDLIIIGMGSPRQEIFLEKLKRHDLYNNSMIFTCGGFFHQTQHDIQYYPIWINKLHLRMPYRLIKEKLYDRLILYPKFVITFFADLFKYKFNR